MGLVLPRRRMVPGLLSAAAILYLAPSASAKGPSSAGDAPAKSEKPSELDSLKEQLAKKTDEASTCDSAKGELEFNLGQLQQVAEQKLGEAEATIKGLQDELANAQGTAAAAASTADSAKKAEEELKKAGEELKALQKKYETLKKSADDEADATEKKQKELQKEIKTLKKDVETGKKEKASLEAKVIETTEAAAAAAAAAGSGPEFLTGWVDLATFGKVTGVVYKNLLESRYTEIESLTKKQASVLSKTSYALFKTVLANLQDGGSKLYAKSVDLYYTHVQPLVVQGKNQGMALYKVHAAQHLDPVLETASKTYASLNVDKHVEKGWNMGKNATGDAYQLLTQKVIPQAHELLASKDLLQDVRGFAFQPLTFQIFNEQIKLESGVWDLLMFFFVFIFLTYFVLYQFVLKFLLFQCLLKFLVFHVLLNLLLRKVLVSFAIGLSWKFVSLAFGLFVFAVKLAFCCGCCGLCFRRSKAGTRKAGSSSGSSGKGPGKAEMKSSSDKKGVPPSPPGAPNSQTKKKR